MSLKSCRNVCKINFGHIVIWKAKVVANWKDETELGRTSRHTTQPLASSLITMWISLSMQTTHRELKARPVPQDQRSLSAKWEDVRPAEPCGQDHVGWDKGLQGSPCPAPSQRELSLEGICICLLFLVQITNGKQPKEVSVLKIRDHFLFLILFPSLLWFLFLPSLSPTLRTQSSAGSIVTSFDYLRGENVRFVTGIKWKNSLFSFKNKVSWDCSIKNICFSWKWFSI